MDAPEVLKFPYMKAVQCFANIHVSAIKCNPSIDELINFGVRMSRGVRCSKMRNKVKELGMVSVRAVLQQV